MRLDGKTAIITGASAGIGRACALLFAQHGAKLIIGARREKELQDVAHEITQNGGQALACAGDVREEAYAKQLVELAGQNYGGLDIALNNAGTLGEMGDISSLSKASWSETLEVNLTSAFLGAKYQIPAMAQRGKGSLLFTSSFVGYSAGMPGMASYAASKAGLVGLTKVLAVEHGAQNIRVNAILPGGTDTDMAAEFANTPETEEFVRSLHAMKRIAEPDEIAQTALFLASDASSFTTGTAALVDGGISINKT